MNAEDYVGVRIWHACTGSYAYYIEAVQAQAAAASAPADALFEREGKWVCVSDLKADHWFRPMYEAELAKAKSA